MGYPTLNFSQARFFWIWKDLFDLIGMLILSFVCITVKANSIAVNNIAKKRHIDCKEQETKERPLGKGKAVFK